MFITKKNCHDHLDAKLIAKLKYIPPSQKIGNSYVSILSIFHVTTEIVIAVKMTTRENNDIIVHNTMVTLTFHMDHIEHIYVISTSFLPEPLCQPREVYYKISSI